MHDNVLFIEAKSKTGKRKTGKRPPSRSIERGKRLGRVVIGQAVADAFPFVMGLRVPALRYLRTCTCAYSSRACIHPGLEAYAPFAAHLCPAARELVGVGG